ncbi:MAG: helix-turn-helix domain-containing protein, partial [Kiritimatiellae bacterium]|nr:helix-turn-helix domain-containing protein [Kiritimatiellia bacterium]
MTKGKKQMVGTQRCRIEFGLAAGESERTIAKEIGVSLSTVSRE